MHKVFSPLMCWFAVQMRTKDAGDLTVERKGSLSLRLGCEKYLLQHALAATANRQVLS
jgi:hypothetical protein